MGVKLFVLAPVVCSLCLCSCAAMFTGSTDDVHVVPHDPEYAEGWVVKGADQSVPVGGTLVGLSKKTRPLTFENTGTGEALTLELPRKFLPPSLTVDLERGVFIG